GGRVAPGAGSERGRPLLLSSSRAARLIPECREPRPGPPRDSFSTGRTSGGALAKRGPKPKDLSAYLAEAHEERRLFPKLTANAIGNRIAAKHPEVTGLAQAIRKALAKEKKESSAIVSSDPPTTPAPPAPSSSPPLGLSQPPPSRRRRFKSPVERAREA